MASCPDALIYDHPSGSPRERFGTKGAVTRQLDEIFGSEGILSEILHNKRDLNKAHIKKLRERFYVSVFF